MHAAIEALNPARPDGESSSAQAVAGSRRLRLGEAVWWIVGLLVVVSLALADGLTADVVAYERDTTVFYFPLMSWVAQQLHQGQLPLWTPQVFGGYPIFADGEIGLAYPPVLLALLLLPPDRAFVALRLVHLAIAVLGAFALARAWRLPYPSAAMAGVVFALGSFLSAQVHHENIVRTASWLPLMLALVERALQAADWRPRLRWMALAASALGLAGLSLHSQMLAMDLLILAGYGAFRWAIGPLTSVGAKRAWFDRLGSVARVCGPIVVFGFGLAAVQLVPLVELAGFSARGSGIPYLESAAYSLTPYGLVQLIFPYVFRGQGNVQWGLWTHWESYLYVGLAPLVLALIALVCVRRREVAGWGVMGGVGLLLALGQYSPINLHYLLWLLPGLSGLRAPGRFTLVVMLAGGMLAAYGLAWLQALASGSTASFPTERRRLRVLLTWSAWAVGCIALGVVGVHVALMVWPGAASYAIQAWYLSLSRDSYPLPVGTVLNGLLWSTDLTNPRLSGALFGLTVVLGALWVWQVGGSARLRTWRGWPTVFVGLAAVDLLAFGWAIHPREPLSVLAAEPPAIQAIENLPSVDGAPNRALSAQVLNQLSADRLAPFGRLQEAGGYSSLEFTWHRDYLGRVLYVDDGLLDLWNVRFILDPARYGKLSAYKGVDFLQQQAMLHSPAGSSLSEQQFALPAGSPIVQLKFVSALMGAVNLVQGTTVAQIELRDGSDQVVGTAELQAGRDTMDWAWNLPEVQRVVKHQRVETAGVASEGNSAGSHERELSFAELTFDRPVDGAVSMVVRAVPPAGELVLYGGAAVSPDGSAQQLFGRTKTKYRQVYVDRDIRVLENTAAQPRAFIVPNARIASSLGNALNEMVHQPFEPSQEVILADDTTTQSLPIVTERGGQGTATITSYAPDSVRIQTSTSDDAWLVLSDTYYPGWRATVDSQPVTVLRGDVLFRAVPVPAGQHEVDFRFEPRSVRVGLPISLGALLLLLAGVAFAGKSGWRRRTTSA